MALCFENLSSGIGIVTEEVRCASVRVRDSARVMTPRFWIAGGA